MTVQDLRNGMIRIAAAYLIDAGLHKHGQGMSFNQKFATQVGADVLVSEATKWISSNYSRTIGEYLSDTYDLLMIVQKSKINMDQAQLDYRDLKKRKAARLAKKILDDNKVR